MTQLSMRQHLIASVVFGAMGLAGYYVGEACAQGITSHPNEETHTMTTDEASAYAAERAGHEKNGWNRRFIEALSEAGYKLQPINYRDPRPDGSIDAPLPYECGEDIQIGVSRMCTGGWHYPSIIVPSFRHAEKPPS